MKGKYVTTMVLYGIRVDEGNARKIHDDWLRRCEIDENADFVASCPQVCLLADKIDSDEHSRHYEPGHRHIFGIVYAKHGNDRLDNLATAISQVPSEMSASFDRVVPYLESLGIERIHPEAILINQHI